MTEPGDCKARQREHRSGQSLINAASAPDLAITLPPNALQCLFASPNNGRKPVASVESIAPESVIGILEISRAPPADRQSDRVWNSRRNIGRKMGSGTGQVLASGRANRRCASGTSHRAPRHVEDPLKSLLEGELFDRFALRSSSWMNCIIGSKPITVGTRVARRR